MEVDKYKLADEIRKSYLKHGNDSWVSIANDILPLLDVSGKLPTDREIEKHWEGIENMHLEAKRMSESQIKDIIFGAICGAEWMRDLVKGNYS